MQYKVLKKQKISRDCFVCGTDNNESLKTKFYELENGELLSISNPLPTHQSYPDRMHGGIISAILDEAIGRSIMIEEPMSWGVTVELNIKYRKPVSLSNPIKAITRVTKNKKMMFEGTGEIILEDGSIAVEAHAKYVKMSLEKICNETGGDLSMMIDDESNAPDLIEL